MSSIFPPRLIKYILSNKSDSLRDFVNSSKYGLNSNKIFRFKGLANGANGNEKFEVSRTF